MPKSTTKMTKARVMWACHSNNILSGSSYRQWFSAEDPATVFTGLWQPFPSHKAATKAAKFANLTREQQVERVAECLRTVQAPVFASKISWGRCLEKSQYREQARAVLNVIFGAAP